MINILLLTGLKLKLIARRPTVLAFCVILPLLLSLLAGATVVRNDLSNLQPGYVDLADNDESHRLISMFESSELGWRVVREDEIARALELGTLDGVLVIPEHFGMPESTSTIDERYAAEFIHGKNELAGDLIRENYSIAVLALAMNAKLLKDLSGLEGAKTLSTQEIERRLTTKALEARAEGADLRLEIRDDKMGDSLPLIQVPDVAVEVLFLSIFSLLTSLMLADASTERRMRSLPGGFRRDYLSTLLALALTGILQLALMVGGTRLFMPETTRPENYVPVMAVLLLLMLAFGQLVALIPGDRRFVPASLLLFISILTGGSFIQLPAFWMHKVGQFTPHGWALAHLQGMEVRWSVPLVGLLALMLLGVAFVLQRRSDTLSG